MVVRFRKGQVILLFALQAVSLGACYPQVDDVLVEGDRSAAEISRLIAEINAQQAAFGAEKLLLTVEMREERLQYIDEMLDELDRLETISGDD